MNIITKSPGCRLLMLLICCMSQTGVYAEEKPEYKNPIGCSNVGYQFDMHTLRLEPVAAGGNQSLYFLYNSTPTQLTLYQMRGMESSRSLYLNHRINPGQWAVLSTSEKQVKFICTVPDGKSAYGKIVNCADSMNVCEYVNVKYGLNNRGNYWLVNSNTRSGAVGDVVRYGIIPGA